MELLYIPCLFPFGNCPGIFLDIDTVVEIGLDELLCKVRHLEAGICLPENDTGMEVCSISFSGAFREGDDCAEFVEVQFWPYDLSLQIAYDEYKI